MPESTRLGFADLDFYLCNGLCGLSPKAVIKKGSAILPNASINYGAVITCACIVNMGAIVDHNVFLSNGVHVCPGAVVKGENLIPAFMKIESGTVIGRAQFPFD